MFDVSSSDSDSTSFDWSSPFYEPIDNLNGSDLHKEFINGEFQSTSNPWTTFQTVFLGLFMIIGLPANFLILYVS
jgi:hypothetical protein